MREMKDSEIEWFGEIPAGWKKVRIGGLYMFRNTKVNDRDYPPLSVTMKGILPQLETAAKSNAHDDRKLVCKGDFVINSRSDRRGSCGISSYYGSVSLINTVLAPRSDMNPVYYNWLFHTIEFSDEFYKWGHGIVDDLWTTGWQEMKKIFIPVPPLSEQNAIANYLDKKCAEIDKLTADIKTQIKVLENYKKSIITETVTKGLNSNVEMKDSGVEWVRKIPVAWKCIKIKYLTKQRNEKSIFQPQIDKYIGLENVKSYSNEFIETESEYEESLQSICKKGDVLFNKLRPYLAKVLIVESDCFCTGEFLQFKVFEGDKKFLWYSLLNPSFIEVVNSSTYGAKMPRANSEFICNMKIPFPPLYEQNAIANFLDDKCVEIDKIIADKNKQLATIEEYKKSLIYEYVTGKKSV